MMKAVLIICGIVLLILNNTWANHPSKKKRPNILFAISDDQSFEHTSFAGCRFIKTPAFDQIAKEGIYFTNCYAGSPGCAPSRSSIVTGRHHWQNEQSGQHASSWLKKYISFIDLLDANGYITGRTGKGVDPFKYARNKKDTLRRYGNAAGTEHSNIKYTKENDDRNARGIKNTNYFGNFKYFMENVRNEKPFFFWYGCNEPHRKYEKDSWKKNGKSLDNVKVPGFLPDNNIIRGDLLDYAVEIEWFDLHLQRMLEYLDNIGELENTIVIVTADNGMPFPRCKANTYEYGCHVPFAISYPNKFPGGRIVNDPISFIDIAPTILELTGTKSDKMMPITGTGFRNILVSEKDHVVDTNRQYVFSGRERHTSARYKNMGYPQRAIRSKDYLLIWNMKPDRWPAGAPQQIDPENSNKLLPLYGIDSLGVHKSNWAFWDIDASPTKSFITENHDSYNSYFELAVGKRPEFELYDIRKDVFCLKNLFGNPEYKLIQNEMKEVLMKELIKSEDPRIVGPDKEVFDSYKRYRGNREFPKPDWQK